MRSSPARARLYVDEDILPDLARVLRGRGEDAVSAHDVGRLGVADSAQLAYAAQEGRAIVTSNVADFIRLAREWSADVRSHAGIIVSYRQISRSEVGVAARALLRLLSALDADALRDAVHVLDIYR
ncbi:MAG: DUF5615 family PIN-like protein [Chloroflexota bacterium]|nr:DUF5615 family PIN-like protein [Chloroflexota bacterium]